MAKVYDLDGRGARVGGPRTSTEPLDGADELADAEMAADLQEDEEDMADNGVAPSPSDRSFLRVVSDHGPALEGDDDEEARRYYSRNAGK